ncbi:hypothetical protein DWB77_07522 [Streptomyces hundungensis]|uniref:Uncharacterized protein n=1 Tax=Streptomyces hundungensis TaxID=1077946 RepID=A0A387HN40_9ACTN|nr:hypothetical protein [Streptomyces hundungensis]AYG77963.1 hypothetical protein DWB77_00070 [Streptomyces hundungensis]AYG85305.1 hypothetical protein DWB77_07522 [Streptomyces hundungensis]
MTTEPHHPLPEPELRPFATEPGRWHRELQRTQARLAAGALDQGPGYRRESHRVEEHTRIDERTAWGWLRWPAPLSEDAPVVPLQIAVLSPMPSRAARLASRWLTRRPPLRIYFDARCRFWVTSTTVLAAFLALTFVGAAMAKGLPADVGVPLMLLIPALAEHVPGRLDARARVHARIVQDETGLREMQRFLGCHQIIQAADDRETPELARAVELGHHLLWDIAGVLTRPAAAPVHELLLAREYRFTQLASQAVETQTAKQERDRRITRTGWDRDTAMTVGRPVESALERQLLPDALIEEAIHALHQAATAYRAATEHLHQLDHSHSGWSPRPTGTSDSEFGCLTASSLHSREGGSDQ